MMCKAVKLGILEIAQKHTLFSTFHTNTTDSKKAKSLYTLYTLLHMQQQSQKRRKTFHWTQNMPSKHPQK